MGRVEVVVAVFTVFAVVAIVASYGSILLRNGDETAPTPCEDGWTSYKDEKCIKIFSQQFLQYSSAKAYCESVDPTESTASLLSIKNEEEQKYFHDFIFVTSKYEGDIWLGLQKTNGLYIWPDSSSLEFDNFMNVNCTIESDAVWINATMESADDVLCVEMINGGRWSPVSCTENKTVVCERQQTWPLHKIQKSFLDFKRQQLNNPVPIGFIYVQLSKQPDPTALWPAVKWEDITTIYAGLFFRAEGSGSVKFNDGEQDENLPRIISVEPTSLKARQRILMLGSGARLIWREKYQQFPWKVKVNYSEQEVRPRNEAIRIWTRTQ